MVADPELRFAAALRLPTFEIGGLTLYKRVTLVVFDGAVARVFYAVFRPDRTAAEVGAYLSTRA